MTNKSTGDLFNRSGHQTDEDQRPQQEPPIHPKDGDRVNATTGAEAFLQLTVDQWIEAEGMDTIELSSPRGKMWMTKNKKAYKRLVDAGEVVFSPLEVERLIELVHKDSGAISEKLLDNIYEMKRHFGARLDAMRLDFPPADEAVE